MREHSPGLYCLLMLCFHRLIIFACLIYVLHRLGPLPPASPLEMTMVSGPSPPHLHAAAGAAPPSEPMVLDEDAIRLRPRRWMGHPHGSGRGPLPHLHAVPGTAPPPEPTPLDEDAVRLHPRRRTGRPHGSGPEPPAW
jgi:hypothetical protein